MTAALTNEDLTLHKGSAEQAEQPFKKVPKQFQERPHRPFVFPCATTIGEGA